MIKIKLKSKFESNNIFPTDKGLNIHLATIIIRANFAQEGKYYPQLVLDDVLYKNVRVWMNWCFRWNWCWYVR